MIRDSVLTGDALSLDVTTIFPLVREHPRELRSHDPGYRSHSISPGRC